MKGSAIAVLMLILMLSSFGVVTITLGDDDEDNPHTEMLEDEFICLDCHTKKPGKDETSPDYFLVDLPSENCLGCHEEMTHSGNKEHEQQDAEPMPADENGKIACFTCHDPHPQGAIEGRVVFESTMKERTRKFIRLIAIPAAEERTDKTLESISEKEVYLRYSVEDNQLCVKCHDELNGAEPSRSD